VNVLVIGGGGFIGSRVVAALVAHGHSVACLLRPSSRTERIDGLQWERVDGDVRDVAAVARAAVRRDAVVHLASPSSWQDIRSAALTETNVGGTANVLAAVRNAGARAVFVSSVAAVACSDRPIEFDESATFEPPARTMPYAVAKQAAERLCREAARDGVDAVIVNPGEVYGPNDTGLVTSSTLVDFARSTPVLVCPGGTAVAHVDDVADGIVRAMTNGRRGERYILAGENLTVRALAELTLRCLNRRAAILSLPGRPLRAIARLGAAVRLPLPFNPDVIPYATRYWFVRTEKARAELGATFRSAEATVGPTVEWLRSQGLVA